MTKFGMAALAGVALAVAALVTPALASAALASNSRGSLAPVEFNVSEDLNLFGFKKVVFNCSDYNGGMDPYLAYGSYTKFLAPVTYFTGDGEPIGHYAGDIKPAGVGADPFASTFTGASTTLSPHHGTVTFYCANTEQAANQKL